MQKFYRKINPKRDKKCHSSYSIDDNPTFWNHPKSKFFLNEKLVGGDVVFHQFYEKTYIFLFIDENEPYFANTKGYIGVINNPHYLRKATESETKTYLDSLSENGFSYRNNRIYKKNTPIGYKTPTIY